MKEKDLEKNWEKDKKEIVNMINFQFKSLVRQMLNYCEIAIPFESKSPSSENWLRYQTLRSKLLGCVNHSKRDILDYLRDFVIGRITERKSYRFNFGSSTIKEEENGTRKKGSSREKKIHIST